MKLLCVTVILALPAYNHPASRYRERARSLVTSRRDIGAVMARNNNNRRPTDDPCNWSEPSATVTLRWSRGAHLRPSIKKLLIARDVDVCPHPPPQPASSLPSPDWQDKASASFVTWFAESPGNPAGTVLSSLTPPVTYMFTPPRRGGVMRTLLFIVRSFVLFVCLSVCEQDNSRTHLQMSTKHGIGMGKGWPARSWY